MTSPAEDYRAAYAREQLRQGQRWQTEAAQIAAGCEDARAARVTKQIAEEERINRERAAKLQDRFEAHGLGSPGLRTRASATLSK